MRVTKLDGLPIKDAKKDVVLTITPEDIRRGRSGKPDACAVAQACMRQLHCSAARVHLARIYGRGQGTWYRYMTPGSIRSEIIAYDRRSSFKPGDYLLHPPGPSHKTNGKQQGSKKSQTKPHAVKKFKKKRAVPYHMVEGVRLRAGEDE